MHGRKYEIDLFLHSCLRKLRKKEENCYKLIVKVSNIIIGYLVNLLQICQKSGDVNKVSTE